jgi:radical SAM superfamily enzyme YgiQ (UPF0313 family)
MKIADLILSKGLNIRFGIETRTDKLDEEQLRLLHRAGLRSVEIGIESANEEMLLENLRKAPGKEQQEAIIDLCHRLGIRVIANYILGSPMTLSREFGGPSPMQRSSTRLPFSSQ